MAARAMTAEANIMRHSPAMNLRRLTGRVLPAAFVAVALTTLPVRAQESRVLDEAVAAYNEGRYAEAALAFFNVAENAGVPRLAYQAEYYLALSLYELGLHHSALYYDSLIIDQGPNHPFYKDAVKNLLAVMEAVGDRNLVPNLLDREYNEAFAELPLDVLNRVNFIVALWQHYQRRPEDARAFLDALPRDSSSFHRGRYLRGVQMVQIAQQALSEGAEKEAEGAYEAAADVFNEVIRLVDASAAKTKVPRKKKGKEAEALRRQAEELTESGHLATLALARVRYGQGRFEEAVALYERIPRFSKHWRDALFEGAYAAFRADDPGRALGLLQTLHAPVAKDQFVPESYLLKALIYFSYCLYDEAKATLAELDRLHDESYEAISEVLEPGRALDVYFALMTEGKSGEDRIPAAVRNELLRDDALRGYRSYVAALAKEEKKLASQAKWKGTLLSQVLSEAVAQQRNVLVQSAGRGVQRALKLMHFHLEDVKGQYELVKYEIARNEKNLLERGHDREETLRAQSLGRPAVPEKRAEYWSFDGEYWPDELGYYRFTLKNACPAQEGDDGSQAAR